MAPCAPCVCVSVDFRPPLSDKLQLQRPKPAATRKPISVFKSARKSFAKPRRRLQRAPRGRERRVRFCSTTKANDGLEVHNQLLDRIVWLTLGPVRTIRTPMDVLRTLNGELHRLRVVHDMLSELADRASLSAAPVAVLPAGGGCGAKVTQQHVAVLRGICRVILEAEHMRDVISARYRTAKLQPPPLQAQPLVGPVC